MICGHIVDILSKDYYGFHCIYIYIYIVFNAASQELFCNVQINSSQVQTSDRKVFNTMQTAVYEFVNNRKWTNSKIQNEERIECSILINISRKLSNDEF